MELLVLVINEDDKVEPILSGFLTLGIKGATVVNSQGMARRVNEKAPVLAGLQDLLSRSRPQNTTVFSVIETSDQLEAAMQLIQRICGDLHDPGTGIVFTIPVSRVVGLASHLSPPKD